MTHVRRHFKSNHPPKYPALQKSIRDTVEMLGPYGVNVNRWGVETTNETLATLNVEDESMEDRLGLLNINVYILPLS